MSLLAALTRARRKALRSAYALAMRPLKGRALRRKYRIAGMLHSRVMAALHTEPIAVDEHLMYIDWEDSLALRSRPYEPLETLLIRRLVRPGTNVVDLGAHIGYYTLILATGVGANGHVFAFEPDPKNFRLLQKNAALNGLRNVTLENAAVSDRSGTVRLFLAVGHVGDHRIFDSTGERRAIEVPSITLDDYFQTRDFRIGLLKMDIQGAEPAALRGMSRLLRREPEMLLLTEYDPQHLAEFGVEPSSYLRMLRGEGFDLCEIDEVAGAVRPVEDHDLLARYPSSSPRYTNLLCARGYDPRVQALLAD